MLELAKDNGVTQMNIRGGGVHAEIDAQGLSGFEGGFELGLELGFGNDFGDAFFQVAELFFDGFEFCWHHELNSAAPKHAAAFDFEFSFEDDSNGFGIDAMLLLQ